MWLCNVNVWGRTLCILLVQCYEVFKSNVTVEYKIIKWRSCWNLVTFWIDGIKYIIVYIFVAQQPATGLDLFILEVFRWLARTYTHTHMRIGRTPLDKWSARCRSRYLHNTQYSQEPGIPVLSGILTLDFNDQAAVDICLRPVGHRDRNRNISATRIKSGTEINGLRTIQSVRSVL